MGDRRRTHNKDHYTAAGRSQGPAGPLEQFKRELSQERAVVGRDQERKIPTERPPAPRPPAEESEE